jgi:hypothetical protein
MRTGLACLWLTPAILVSITTTAFGAQSSAPPGAAAAARTSGVLTAAEVNGQIVGRRVQGDGIQWSYYPDGRYESDDGRVARGGTYVVRPDGRLCWDDVIGVSGCFQYYRQAGRLHVRRADPDNDFELGAVTVGPIPR